jgi:hypothetical protein
VLQSDGQCQTCCGITLPVREALHCAKWLQCPAASKHSESAVVAALCSLSQAEDCLPCSTLADALWQQNAAQLPHTLPDANQMQQLIHDLPLRLVDTRNSSSEFTVESRVLQVPTFANFVCAPCVSAIAITHRMTEAQGMVGTKHLSTQVMCNLTRFQRAMCSTTCSTTGRSTTR